ncbi:uncharacterized protein LOC129566087 isoform X2 [Sitodiplosis mosellana]|uniref:uncharacterized protein LOC129566087 isoform X2 n=1 Tax=Sitodiplosis mosellana TaxID=263140 RepID=UPI00244496E8|nr:uncharacterized protein LOC129566087 isoform X2 [Sitodiplosis mosellana]
MMMKKSGLNWCICIIVLATSGLCAARSGLYSEESPSSVRIEQCHEGCIKKFAMDDMSCLQQPECSMCWDECTSSTSINKSILDTWSLSVQSMVRDNSLVSTNIAWTATNSPSDCLVTWEVSGGGLIGNLLTQSSNVELSLWPETKYRVQVTCKNKQSEEISRSLPLTLDTNKAVVMVRVPTASTSILTDSDDTVSQQQDQSIILRDSSNHGNGITSTSQFSDNETNDNDDDDDANNNNNNIDNDSQKFYQQIHFDETSFESTLAQSSLLVWATYENHREFLLGACAAMGVFLTVIFVFLLNRRKSRANTDKAPLVDNEVSVNVDVDRLTIHV